ncbi:MAG: sensor histidine kinase, partial [Myxococcota bacterium]
MGRLAGGLGSEIEHQLLAIQHTVNAHLAAPRNEEERELTDDIVSATSNALATARRLVALRTDSTPPEVARCDARPIVETLVRQLRRQYALHIEAELDAESAAVGMTAEDFERVIHNLCLNAKDAMPRGGVLRIALRNDGLALLCEVSDTGEGMGPEVVDRIFDPFFSTKGEGGNGLGLSVVERLMKRAGGSVDVESALGAGTRFVLRFPPAPPAFQVPAAA